MRSSSNRQGGALIFPLLYHTHSSLHPEDLPFWLGLAREAGGPVLELGCGSGRVLASLVAAGYPTVGLDRDRAMLAFLRQNLAGSPAARAGLLQADMAAFHLGLQFGLILVPCNTFSLLQAEARQASLARVAQHLRSGGLFAASLPNPLVLRRLPRRGEPELEEIFPHPDDGEPVQVSSAWQRSRREFCLTWIYDHLLPDGQVERCQVTVCHTLDGPEVHQQALEEAGLHLEQMLGDFNGAPFQADSPSLILVAKKP